MTHFSQGAGVYTTAMAKRDRRRRQVVAGVAGLALVLGAGAYATTTALLNNGSSPDVAAPAPLSTSAVPEPSQEPSVVPSRTATKSIAKPTRSPSPSPLVSGPPQDFIDPTTTATRTELRPPAPRGNIAAVPPEDIKVTNTGSLNSAQGTMRLVTAKGDLSGLRELAWVADEGTKYGEVRCSKTFNFSSGTAPSERPTMLICWRTSAQKSVYTVAVKLSGPTPPASVAMINREWARLG